MWAHFRHLRSKRFFNDISNSLIQWILTPAIMLWRFKSPLALQLPKWVFTWECGVHSFTLSHTPGRMKCDSWASFLACTFTSPCLGHKPKAKVATLIFHVIMTWHAIWQQIVTIFMAIHDILWDHKFLCVLNLWHQYLSLHAIQLFVCHDVFEIMCICTKQSNVNS